MKRLGVKEVFEIAKLTCEVVAGVAAYAIMQLNPMLQRPAEGLAIVAAAFAAVWVMGSTPSSRIVSEELWAAAHERLRGAREIYLRDTRGKLWGKPANGVESKYLLTGMAVCTCCGGALTVRHGKGRGRAYMCLTHVTRGPRVCANGLSAPMERFNFQRSTLSCSDLTTE